MMLLRMLQRITESQAFQVEVMACGGIEAWIELQCIAKEQGKGPAMTRVTEPRTYKRRPEAELRIALSRVLKFQQTLHVPPQESDEDYVLSDAIEELLDLRQRRTLLEALSPEARHTLAFIIERARRVDISIERALEVEEDNPLYLRVVGELEQLERYLKILAPEKGEA